MRLQAVRQIIWLCGLMASSLVSANEMPVAELVGVPESIEINGVVLTGSAHPYFNYFPSVAEELPVDCQRHGRFIVIVNVPVKNSNLRKLLSATRIWVAQGDKTWSGAVLKTHIRREADRIIFSSRDCNAPIVPVRHPIRGQFDLNNAIRAKTIIELEYAGKRHLLRLPDAVVGVAS